MSNGREEETQGEMGEQKQKYYPHRFEDDGNGTVLCYSLKPGSPMGAGATREAAYEEYAALIDDSLGPFYAMDRRTQDGLSPMPSRK